MAKHVVRINDESKAVVAPLARELGLSHSETVDVLVKKAHARMEALRKDKAKRQSVAAE